MIDVERENFDKTLGILSSRIHIYGINKNQSNSLIAKYINEKEYDDFVYNKRLGSYISVKGVDNDYYYTFEIKVQYVKLDISINFVDKFS